MKLRETWPVSTPRTLMLLRIGAVALLASVGWAVENYGTSGYFTVLLISALLFGLSSGWKVELSGREMILIYGFGLFRVRTGEILEVSNLGDLRFGRLLRHLSGELITPIFFLLLSVVLFGVRGLLVLPFVLYWLILYSLLLAFPVKLLKERTGRLMVLALLLPWALSMPFVVIGVEFQWFGLSLVTSLFGFWFLIGFVSRDYVLLRGEFGEFLVACNNARRIITALAGGGDGP
jgi:hypothetical protein